MDLAYLLEIDSLRYILLLVAGSKEHVGFECICNCSMFFDTTGREFTAARFCRFHINLLLTLMQHVYGLARRAHSKLPLLKEGVEFGLARRTYHESRLV